jgi:hypothetical protein
MLYLATREYQRIGLDLKRGDEVTLSEGVAAWVNRDSPGTLELVEGETETRVIEQPPADRMVRQAVLRGEAALDEPITPHVVVEGATKSGKKR